MNGPRHPGGQENQLGNSDDVVVSLGKFFSVGLAGNLVGLVAFAFFVKWGIASNMSSLISSVILWPLMVFAQSRWVLNRSEVRWLLNSLRYFSVSLAVALTASLIPEESVEIAVSLQAFNVLVWSGISFIALNLIGGRGR